MKKKRWENYRGVEFRMFFELMIVNIEKYLGEPHNPDDMLAEGQSLNTTLQQAFIDKIGASAFKVPKCNNSERRAFKELKAAISKAKKFVDYFAERDWRVKLDVPAKIPQTRDKLREAARAVLSAWDENSADPELTHVAPAMIELRAAFDTYLAAWDARRDASRISKEKTVASREIRAKCEKYVIRVKKHLSLYLDPYAGKWHLYGFQPRQQKGKESIQN